MKRNYWLIVLALCAFFLCGCTSKSNKTVVQFASWGSKTEVDIIKPILNDFENKNPQIKVDFLHIPQNYFQKIHLLFASNTPPDVIFINNLYLPVYANFLEEMKQPNNYYTKALEALTFEGELLAIPRDVSNLVIFYNKDLFDKKNIAYPKNDWTFDDFLATNQKVTGDGVFGISFDEEPMFYLPYLMSNGGGILPDEIIKSQSQKSLDFYADLRKKYHVAPKKSESASATMAQMFLQERLGMYLSGRWIVPKIKEDAKFKWDIINFPSGSVGSIVPMDASGWAVAKSSKHKQEAFKLVEFLSSKENIEKFSKSGLIVPARTDVKLFDNGNPEHSQVFFDVIETSKPTPVTVNYREIIDNLKKNMEIRFN